MGHLAAVLVALYLGAEASPVNVWTGADPSGACKGNRVVQTTTGKTFACVSSTWKETSSYNLVFFFPDTMVNNQTLTRFLVPKAFTIPASCTGSLAGPGTNPTSTAVVTIKKNGSSVATVSIATNGTATFTCTTATSFAAGDILTVSGPATADATMADLSLTLVGVL